MSSDLHQVDDVDQVSSDLHRLINLNASTFFNIWWFPLTLLHILHKFEHFAQLCTLCTLCTTLHILHNFAHFAQLCPSCTILQMLLIFAHFAQFCTILHNFVQFCKFSTTLPILPILQFFAYKFKFNIYRRFAHLHNFAYFAAVSICSTCASPSFWSLFLLGASLTHPTLKIIVVTVGFWTFSGAFSQLGQDLDHLEFLPALYQFYMKYFVYSIAQVCCTLLSVTTRRCALCCYH